jgi:hypothetical protein
MLLPVHSGGAVQKLQDLLAERAGEWQALALDSLRRPGVLDAGLGPQLVAHLTIHRDELARWLAEAAEGGDRSGDFARDPVGRLVTETVKWLQRRNQFLDLGQRTVERLEALHRRSLRALSKALSETAAPEALAAALEAVFEAHGRDLVAMIGELTEGPAGEVPVRREVVCSEYSPELQLEVLGLDVRSLEQPVLDLGCGESAALVRHLRAIGIEACGIDRVAAAGDHVAASDWLEAVLEPRSFGTVISHLAFSHHFVHHHLRGGPQPERYARRYMEILRALRSGGTFAYAPGLPFIEDLLPKTEYEVVRRPIARLGNALVGAGLVHGDLPLYACQVRRL